MKTLFLVHSHPELQAGGTEIFSRDLFRALSRLGIQGLYLAGTAPHQRPASPGTSLQAISQFPDELLIRSGAFDSFMMSQIDLHGVGPALVELLSQHQPDIVHVHHLLTLGIEALQTIRRCAPNAAIVMTLHDYYAMCANDGQLVTTAGSLCRGAHPDRCRACFPERSLAEFKLRQLYIGRMMEHVDRFIAPSRFLRDRFVEWGIPANRIDIVPNGLPQTDRAPHRLTRRRDCFGFFGHINQFKGATVALEASEILTRNQLSHTLRLHGSTEFQTEETVSRFRDACARAPDATYLGPYRRLDFARLVEQVDWLVFPSTWWENAPLIINEAFQHGRPVLCSNIGGAVELVHHAVNGMHFPVGDARALAETMRVAIEDESLWQHLVDGIEPIVTIEESARRHVAFYENVVSHAQRIAA